MPSIFLSHSRKDKDFVKKLASDLMRCGHTVWIDEAEINIGDSLIGKIREGIDRVDFVAAVLSEFSIESSWVQKELELASTREIKEKRVVVLPLLISKVALPGFLEGKLYGDFTHEDSYEENFQKLLRALGPAKSPPKLESNEIAELKEKLAAAEKQVQLHLVENDRKTSAIAFHWSKGLRAAVAKANKKFPLHKPLNEAYAFEINDVYVTLDYLLWAISKEERDGSHPLSVLLTLDEKWELAERMLAAYRDYLETFPHS